MSHWGIPGPGGSPGKCAVCGDDFMAGILMDMMGQKSGITGFNVGFVSQTLYAHDPKCVDAVKEAFKDTEEPATVRDRLPEGPLRKCLAEAIAAQEQPESTEDHHKTETSK